MSEETIIIIAVIVFLIFSVIGFAVWIWSIIHCAKNKRITENNRIIGLILIVLFGLLGSLIYMFLPRDVDPDGYDESDDSDDDYIN